MVNSYCRKWRLNVSKSTVITFGFCGSQLECFVEGNLKWDLSIKACMCTAPLGCQPCQ